jgi:murein DD-endopeptidase MepM/ murein hydrolase activator NlpD
MFPPPFQHLVRFIAAATLGLACVLCVHPASATAARAAWVWPVTGERSIERNYDAPDTAYAPGHRGIDLTAAEGTEVLAPTDAVVSFAGAIAGRGILSLRTADLLISFEAMTTQLVEGDLVRAGQVMGAVSTGTHCSCLHVGVRKAGAYLSPLSYFSAISPAVLQPWDDRLWLRASTGRPALP